jgi:hypothetical protein
VNLFVSFWTGLPFAALNFAHLALAAAPIAARPAVAKLRILGDAAAFDGVEYVV